MCRIPKVIVVAPSDRHTDLRRALGSLEYEIVAAVSTADEVAGISGDVAVVWEPDEDSLGLLRAMSLKTVAIGGVAGKADMTLSASDLPAFKSRIWELFRPA